MGNLKQKHDSHNRKHGAAGKPHRGSAIFRTFIACVTAFTLMMPITATAAIADEETGFDPETVEAPAVDAIDNDTGAGEGETGDAPSGVGVDGEDASDDEAVSGDADKADEEKADGTDADKDGKDATEEDDESKDGKDTKDKDAAEKDDKDKKDTTDKADGKDKDDKAANGKTAEKTPEIVESKGSVIDEEEDADDEAADEKGADEEDADEKDDEAKKMPAQAFEASLTTENGESLTVHVKAPKGAFPLDTTMKVTSVQSEDVPEAVEQAVSARTDDEVVDMQAVDISFKDKDGKEIEPAKKVTVTFESDLISKDDEPMLVHVDDEGAADVLDPLSDKEIKSRGAEVKDNELLVDSDEFSLYVLAFTGELTADVLTADGATYKVTVACGEDAEIPADATLVVAEILPGTDAYQNYLHQAAEALGQENSEDIPFARFFDIEIHDADGAKIEPAAPVQVKIELADAPEAEQNLLQVVHFEGEDETPVVVETKPDEEADVCFEAESFSTWAVITVPPNVTDLGGLTATIGKDYGGQNNTWYAIAANNYDQEPYRLRQSNNSADATQWHFESAEGGYRIYTLGGNGEKLYLHMVKHYPYGQDWGISHVTVQPTTNQQAVDQGCPQTFAVIRNDDGTYTIQNPATAHDLVEDSGFWGQWNNQDGRNHLVFNFQPVTQLQDEYAVIVQSKKDPETYYAVMYDGSLAPVLDYKKEGGSVTEVELDYPLFWTYGTEYCEGGAGWYNGNVEVLYIHEDAIQYDGNQLPDGYYYRCINPNTAEGISSEPRRGTKDEVVQNHPTFIGECAIRYEDYRIQGWSNYIGIDDNETKIIGNVTGENAATVYLAKVKQVPPAEGGSYSENETVNHIDIAMMARATLEFPLAYGKYYDKDKNLLFEVTPDNLKTLTLEKLIPVSGKDIMDGTVTAYNSEGEELVDAFYITGYSSNYKNAYSHDLDQVRMEGSFKVTTLTPYDKNNPLQGDEGGWNRSNDDNGRKALRKDENNQVTYEVSTKIHEDAGFTFDVMYDGVQLYDNRGEPLSVTVNDDLAIAAQFRYWDVDENPNDDVYKPNNECPVVQSTFERNYWWMFPNENIDDIVGRNNELWKGGAILDNNQSSWLPAIPPYTGESGMDFVLLADVKVDNPSVAINITKSIVDANGSAIHPAETVTNAFYVYQSDTADPNSVANGYAVPPNEVTDPSEVYGDSYSQIGDPIEIEVGSEGVSDIYHDYDVAKGMVYVEEDPDKIAQEIVDEDGVEWKYKETRVETEYVWRDDGYNEKGARHVALACSGVPEILGDYKVGEESYYNGFLEFYVYNVYEPAYGNIELTKAVSGASPVETTCVVHLEGTTPAGEKYENYVGITYGPGAPGKVVVEHIPAGTELTITEEYSGPGYDGDTKTLTATIKPGETVTPDDGGQFVNSPNEDAIRGHGIQNNFELMENGDWEFTASPPVQSQSEDQE